MCEVRVLNVILKLTVIEETGLRLRGLPASVSQILELEVCATIHKKPENSKDP